MEFNTLNKQRVKHTVTTLKVTEESDHLTCFITRSKINGSTPMTIVLQLDEGIGYTAAMERITNLINLEDYIFKTIYDNQNLGDNIE